MNNKKVHELDWEESATIGDIQIISLAAVHDSRRGVGDKDKTLWCSWGIISSFDKYYFAGDTGDSSVFQNIGKKYKSFDFAILPIGAYEPR